jgi:O-antigen/teichoic acid export membrane protein
MSGLRQQLINSFMGVGAMRLLSIPVSLASSIILARVLGPTQFGQYAFVLALIPLLALPASGGTSVLLTREVARYTHANSWGRYRGLLRFSHAWVVTYSLLLIVITYIVASSLEAPVDNKWALLPIAALMVPFLGLGAIMNGTLKGLGFPASAEAPTQIIQPGMFLAFVSLVALYGQLTPRLALGGQVVAAAIALLAAAVLYRTLRPEAKLEQSAVYSSSEWTKSLVPITMNVLVRTLNAQVGILMLGLMASDAAVAALRIADRGAQLVVLSLTIVNIVIGPHIVSCRADGEQEKLQRLARQSARYAFVLAAPITLVFVLFGQPILGFVFGDQYAVSSYLPLVILAAGQLISVFFGSVGYLLTMSGREMDTLHGQVIALGVTVVACAALIPFYDAVGAAIGVSTGLLAWNIILARRVFRQLGIRSTAF